MVNPVLTVVVDLILISCAGVIIAGMIREYLASRRPAVGRLSERRDGRAYMMAAAPAVRTIRRRVPPHGRRVA